MTSKLSEQVLGFAGRHLRRLAAKGLRHMADRIAEGAAASAPPPVLGAASTSKLTANIERIAAYTAQHPELRQAHHFLYDLRSPPDGRPEFVIMGINPGETAWDWEHYPQPTEETSRYDFHHRAEKDGDSALRWGKLCRFYLDGADYVLAEVFFWSSRDMSEFKERYGPLVASLHLPFCREMNLDIISAYQPKAVILPGLQSSTLCASLYGLRHVESIRHEGARVVEAFSDGTRPWLFTKHWSGAFGFTQTQRERVREAIQVASQAGSSLPKGHPEEHHGALRLGLPRTS